jgi:site-specific DNA-methyltransferase (adenine-specific)
MRDTIIQGDSKEVLKTIEDDSVDLIVTDPPYGYSFMGKDWDKVVIGVDYWIECLRVLKAGAFAFIMSAPRQDVLSRMIVNLEDAEFIVGFTSIYWCFASGFPKAGNISKMVDKRMGAEREVTGYKRQGTRSIFDGGKPRKTTLPATLLEGSYGGFQPKPALEVVLVVMKPLAEKTYVDQALANGHGITWLDDCRVPTNDTINEIDGGITRFNQKNLEQGYRPYENGFDNQGKETWKQNPQGRFPGNLLVSDDILNDGVERKSGVTKPHHNLKHGYFSEQNEWHTSRNYGGDTGSFSRYFSLDSWWDDRIKKLPESVQKTFPFIIMPKASKAEKNKGCEGLEEKRSGITNFQPENGILYRMENGEITNTKAKTYQRNHHPTVKPIKLFSYLITLGSREGDLILDPFAGSGTSAVACKALNRHYICIERESEYVTIAEARIKAEHSQPELQLAGG